MSSPNSIDPISRVNTTTSTQRKTSGSMGSRVIIGSSSPTSPREKGHLKQKTAIPELTSGKALDKSAEDIRSQVRENNVRKDLNNEQ